MVSAHSTSALLPLKLRVYLMAQQMEHIVNTLQHTKRGRFSYSIPLHSLCGEMDKITRNLNDRLDWVDSWHESSSTEGSENGSEKESDMDNAKGLTEYEAGKLKEAMVHSQNALKSDKVEKRLAQGVREGWISPVTKADVETVEALATAKEGLIPLKTCALLAKNVLDFFIDAKSHSWGIDPQTWETIENCHRTLGESLPCNGTGEDAPLYNGTLKKEVYKAIKLFQTLEMQKKVVEVASQTVSLPM